MNYDEVYKWVTTEYSIEHYIERSKDRVTNNNEFFTPLEDVLYGLTISHDTNKFCDPSISWCDSCAGEGVWLVGVMLKRMQNGLRHEEAVQNLKAIDIMHDNIELTKIRLSGGQIELLDQNNFVVCDSLRYHFRWDGSDPYKTEQDLQFDVLFE